jgi:hypothetical protein
MPHLMEARQGGQQRFKRPEGGKPRLAAAPPANAGQTVELDASELLTRLEVQAAENARLAERAASLERAARAERDARRRLTNTLKRERRAATALHERAERDRAAHDTAVAELERVREHAAATELQLQQVWTRLAEAQRPVPSHELGFWRSRLRKAQRDA